ncbi:MAG: hypothetical protein ACOYVK_22205 [Bacillota bacterium]
MSLFNLSASQFALLASILGIGVANNLNSNQQNSLGNFFESLGQTILTVNAQEQLLQQNQSNDAMCQQLELLRKQIEIMEKQLKHKR